MTPDQELDQVDKAISAILTGGQSYTISSGGGSRQVSMPDLQKLQARKTQLENLIAAQHCGPGNRIVPGW